MATGLVTVPWEFGQALVSGDPERIGKATVNFETALYGGRNTKVDPKAMLQAGKQGVAKASGVVKEGLQSAANAGKQLIKNTAEKVATKMDDLRKDKAVTNIRDGQQNALIGGTNAPIPDEFDAVPGGSGGSRAGDGGRRQNPSRNRQADDMIDKPNKEKALSETTEVTNEKSFNPFNGKTFEEIGRMLTEKGFEKVGPGPKNGRGSYFHPRSGRKYYLDKAGKVYKKTGEELPHVDVHRPNGSAIPEKRKFPLGETLNEE